MKVPGIHWMLVLSVVLAGCATQEDGGTPDGGTPPASQAPAPSDALALFARAAENVPDTFGLDMRATKGGTELVSANAAFDEKADTAYFELSIDPSVAAQGGGALFNDPNALDDVRMYTTPQGNVLVAGDDAFVLPPDDGEETGMGDDSFDELTDPESLLEEIAAGGLNITSVTPTTLRGKGALKLEGTYTDEEGTGPITIHLFQEPVRVARIETTTPAGEDEDDPFAGAVLTMDLLYDDEVALTIPDDVKRLLGMRYESDVDPFGFSDPTAPETWTFQVDGGLDPGEIRAQVLPASEWDTAEPLWSMTLADETKTEGATTITYADLDGDGKLSQGDTLTITRGEGDENLRVALYDDVTQLRVTPGAGAVLALIALAGLAAIVGRRPRRGA